jgi:hypothetical protein
MLERNRGAVADGLAAYLALWHRMRGVIYLRLGDRRRARAQFERALARGGWRLKVCALWLLSLLPRSGAALELAGGLRNRVRGATR